MASKAGQSYACVRQPFYRDPEEGCAGCIIKGLVALAEQPRETRGAFRKGDIVTVKLNTPRTGRVVEVVQPKAAIEYVVEMDDGSHPKRHQVSAAWLAPTTRARYEHRADCRSLSEGVCDCAGTAPKTTERTK